MKFAALVLGLLASGFAFAVDHYFGTHRQSLVALWPDSSDQLIGHGLLYLIIGGGLMGGLLALLNPLSGGLLLLATACGWFALGASLPSGYSAAIVVPLALCFLGSIAGIVAAGRSNAVVTARLPSLEDIRREEALTRDLGHDFEVVAVPEVAPDSPAEVPPPDPIAAGAADPPQRQRSPLLLVLTIANLALLFLLAMAVLLLYLEFKGGSIGQ